MAATTLTLFSYSKSINVITFKALLHFKSTNIQDLGSLCEPCGGVCTSIGLFICLESPLHTSRSGFPWKRLQVVNKPSSTRLNAGSAREQLRLLTVPKRAWWGEGFSINIQRCKIDSLSELGFACTQSVCKGCWLNMSSAPSQQAMTECTDKVEQRGRNGKKLNW